MNFMTYELSDKDTYFNLIDSLKYSNLKDKSNEVMQLFLNGAPFSVEAIEKRILAVDLEYKNTDYMNKMKEVKEILSRSNIFYLPYLILVESQDLSEEDYIYVVRLFNLVFKGKRYIAINNQLVFFPDSEKQFVLNNRINNVIKTYLIPDFKKLIKIIKKIVTKKEVLSKKEQYI